MPVERDSDGFMEWLGDFARDYGVDAPVTDGLSAYKPEVERLGIDHRICTAHVKNRVWNRLDRIDGMGLGQGEDVAAADGSCPSTATWIFRVWSARRGTATRLFAACARSWSGSGGRRYAAAGGGECPMDEQRDGARDRRRQDKAKTVRGLQDRRRDAERVWA